MDQLIDTIRAAIGSGATTEQKASGVQACRTIIAALDTEPGTPIALPGTLSSSPPTRPSLDQVLDMMIAKLTVIANEHDKGMASALPPSNGLRVPATPALPRGVQRQSATSPAPNAPTKRKA